jgi:drug/metabolite transporter (DMT)-like permease
LRHEWPVVALSLGSALAFALSSTLKHISASDAPDGQTLHPRQLRTFIRATLSHPLWLGGIACDVLGLSLQILALDRGALTIVQPLLVTGLVFALILRQRFEHHQITRRQVSWAMALSGALAGFLLLATNGTSAAPLKSADRLPAIGAGIVGAILAAACVEIGRRQRSEGRSAALLGVAVGLVYTATAALLKALTATAVRDPLHVLVSWQLYVVIALGATGLLLNQLAFQAGPITASLPATASVDPLLSIVVGVFVYDEPIRRGPGGGSVLIALIVLLGGAAIQLTRSP